MTAPAPVAPDYAGGCLTNVFSTIVGRREGLPSWAPPSLADATQVVLLVLDGLGWNQLCARSSVAPTLAAMRGGPITSVAPTTTSAALTSISVGRPPGEHGVVGYKISLPDVGVLNVLRWRLTEDGPAVDPLAVQPFQPFAGRDVPVVTKALFAGTAFTTAHLRGARLVGWTQPSGIAVQVARLLRAGEEIVYAYYDGVDHVAHDHGLGELYDAELSWTDRLVDDIVSALPAGAALVVTADHGQVHIGENVEELDPGIIAACTHRSGEARFLWLHARGEPADVLAAAHELYGDLAWVMSRDEIIDSGWLGRVTPAVAGRLGDVAVVVHETFGFIDRNEALEARLVGRHGSLTADEMLVPFVVHRA